LLQSQQEQLQDLKAALEKMASEHGDVESATIARASPGSQIIGNEDAELLTQGTKQIISNLLLSKTLTSTSSWPRGVIWATQ
jgi:hypothetical protein